MWMDNQFSLQKVRVKARKDDERRFHFTENMIENKSVIDFGCGSGGYLARARHICNQVAGVELEQTMRDALNSEGIKCVESIGSLGKADVITLFHVLEHLQNPLDYLAIFKKHLSDDGLLIVEVPNADDALLTLYKSKEFADFTYWICHVYLYNMKTLSMLADMAGYDVVFMRQIQRYPLANHLYWLSQKKPGGHYKWSFIENQMLDEEYASMLERLGIADTIIVGLCPRE